MGRKLNFLEAITSAFSETETNSEPNGIPPSRNQIMLTKIAQQLGISTDELRMAPSPPFAALWEHLSKEAFNSVRAGECLDLLEAFVRINELKVRLRCLQIVREAADVK